NTWTEKSLSKLTELMPGRYAKSEMSSGFIGVIDRYVYRSPLAQAQAAKQAASNAGTTPSNSGTTPGNSGTSPGNSGTTPGNSGTTPSNGGTSPSNGTTPSNPDQTTHPGSVAANERVVKHANPH